MLQVYFFCNKTKLIFEEKSNILVKYHRYYIVENQILILILWYLIKAIANGCFLSTYKKNFNCTNFRH